MTGKFWTLIFLIYGLVFAGLVTMNGVLLAMSVLFLVYLGAGLLFKSKDARLNLTRTLNTTKVREGLPVEVKLTLVNEGARLEKLQLEDELPFGLHKVEGETSQLVILPPGGTYEWTYAVSGRRGPYHFSPLNVYTIDEFGLFQNERSLAAPAQLLVLPELIKIRSVAIRPRQTRGFAGQIPSRLGGSGTDFFGVREYQVGDPLRRLNWKVAARHDEDLFTNEFEQERIADVGIILDARQQTNFRSKGETLFSYAVQATSSLAEAFLRDGNRVSLLVYGYGMERVFPGYGKVQQERILRLLSQAKTGVNYQLESLSYLPTRLFPPRSQIVMISPLSPGDLGVLTRLRANGYQVMIISPDPVDFEMKGYAGKSRELELALRLARIERELMLRQLKQVGIQIVDWQVDQSLDRVIHTALAQQSPAHRIAGIAL